MADVMKRETGLILRSTHTPDYPIADWLHFASRDETLAAEAIPQCYRKIVEGQVVEMIQAEKDAVDCPDLDVYKAVKESEIDARTGELIAVGFTYDGRKFSLSLAAQTSWVGLKAGIDILTFPTSVTAQDGNGEYEIADAAALTAFFGTGVGTYKAHKDSGRALKIVVRAAIDKVGVDAVEDTR